MISSSGDRWVNVTELRKAWVALEDTTVPRGMTWPQVFDAAVAAYDRSKTIYTVDLKDATAFAEAIKNDPYLDNFLRDNESNLIRCIKEVRARSSAGLREAKEATQEYFHRGYHHL